MIMDVGSGGADGFYQPGSDLMAEQIDLSFDALIAGSTGSPSGLSAARAPVPAALATGRGAGVFGFGRDADELKRCLQLPRSPDALNTPVSISGEISFSFTKTDLLEPLPITGNYNTSYVLCDACVSPGRGV